MPGPLGRRRAIGQLRHRLELQSAVDVPGRFREGKTVAWATEATLWGQVDLSEGGEFPRSGGTQANVTGTVTIRQRDGFTPQKRLVWRRAAGDLLLNITAAPIAEGCANFVVVQVKAEAGVSVPADSVLDGGLPASEYGGGSVDGGVPLDGGGP
ncbi:head-tail adaptor protein [bacterium]|nr:head-tail adaptor protein [bacterium]